MWTITPRSSPGKSPACIDDLSKMLFRSLTSGRLSAVQLAVSFIHKGEAIEVHTRSQVTAVCQCLHDYGIGYKIHELVRVDIDEFPVNHLPAMAPA